MNLTLILKITDEMRVERRGGQLIANKYGLRVFA